MLCIRRILGKGTLRTYPFSRVPTGSVVGGEVVVRDMVEAQRGEKVVRWTTRGLWAASFTDTSAVQRAVFSGERRWCDGRRGGMQRCV
jgi:hypothetical protein